MHNNQALVALIVVLLSVGLNAACSSTEFGAASSAPTRTSPSGGDDSERESANASEQDDGAPGSSGADDQGTPGLEGADDGADDSDGGEGAAGEDLSGEDDDACIELPASSKDGDTKASGGQFRRTYYHESVAVDPGKSGVDLARSHGLTPYPVSPDSTLAKTKFTLKKATIVAMIEGGTEEIEYFVFAHQFGRGLDKIKLSLKTSTRTLSDVSTTNIYSAYGYVSIKNMKLKRGVPYGDVDLFSFNYNPNGTTALDMKLRAMPSPQDGTDLIGPASAATTAKVSEKDVMLTGFNLTIDITADAYDTVQYRAIRGNLWSSKKTPAAPKLCR